MILTDDHEPHSSFDDFLFLGKKNMYTLVIKAFVCATHPKQHNIHLHNVSIDNISNKTVSFIAEKKMSKNSNKATPKNVLADDISLNKSRY